MYELLDSGRGAGAELDIISSYPTSVSGIIVLLNTKHLTSFIRAVPSGGGGREAGGQLPPQRFDKVTIPLLEV